MITIPLLILFALYVALLIWVGRKPKTWPIRVMVLLVLLSPAIYWVGSYHYVQYEHKQACARDGGLKVLIRPERADRIRLDADAFSSDRSAYGYLDQYFPQLAVIEAWDGEYTGTGQKSGYFAYSADLTTTALPKKDWKFNKVPLTQPTADPYVLSKSARIEGNLATTTWKLSRNGQVYATWTMFYHYWSRNGVMNIGWQCFQGRSPEALGKQADLLLAELVLK